MFNAAERLGQQAPLSELMREEDARIASESAQSDRRYFFNIHPVEFGTERLDDSLRSLRHQFPDLAITIEIHEAAVSELAVMRRFQELLRSLVKIAVDSGSVPLAEGVETEAEHQVCKELGFELGQGYFYGRPATF